MCKVIQIVLYIKAVYKRSMLPNQYKPSYRRLFVFFRFGGVKNGTGRKRGRRNAGSI